MIQVKLFTFSELPKDMSDVIFKQAKAFMGKNPLDYGAFGWRIGYQKYQNINQISLF